MVGTSRSRRYELAAVLGAAAVTLASCSVISNETTPEPVRIAADLELTGGNAGLGEVYRNALELRVEQVNQLGLLGERRLELEIRDNRSDPATAATNLDQLAADPDVTAIVTGACAECLVAGAGTINERGVPTIALAASSAVSTPVAERAYVFKVGPNPEHTAFELARALLAADASTVALVTTEDLYGEEAHQQMTNDRMPDQLEVVTHEPVNGESDLAAMASRIASFQPQFDPENPEASEQVGPDAVVIWAYSGLAGEVAASLRTAGYDGPLFLDAAAAGELFLSGGNTSALAGATMVFPESLVMDEVVATTPAKAARKTWFQDYTARYGTYHAFSSFAADAIGLVVDAVNRTGGTDRAQLRDTLEVTTMDGLSGALRLTPSQHSGLMPQALTLLTVRGDRWRLGG